MLTRLLTIGAYGWDEKSFYKAVLASGADLFCDVRARRGVRGHEYAFANAARLQAGLAKRGIPYVHFKELAPTQAVRDAQAEVDKEQGVARRKRTELSPEFVAAYRSGPLAKLDSRAFARSLGGTKAPVLFCVEREPKACHRSLLAAKLSKDLKVEVVHVVPSGSGKGPAHERDRS